MQVIFLIKTLAETNLYSFMARATKSKLDPAERIMYLLRYDELNEIPRRIQDSLILMCLSNGADRAYVFDYNYQEGTTSNIYEWCREGIEPQIEYLQNLPITEFPEWITSHENGDNLLIESVAKLKEGPLKKALADQAIQSLIAIPFFQGKVCRGFIGLDWVEREMALNKAEIQLLGLVAQVMGNVHMEYETRDDVLQKQSDIVRKDSLKSILLERNRKTIFWELNLIEKTYTLNEGFETVFGLKSGTFSGDESSLLSLIHDEDRFKFRKAIQQLLKGKKDSWTGSFRIKRKKGFTRVITAMMVYRNLNGQISNILGSLNLATDFFQSLDLFEAAAEIAGLGAMEIVPSEQKIRYTDSCVNLVSESDSSKLSYHELAEMELCFEGEWTTLGLLLGMLIKTKQTSFSGTYLFKLKALKQYRWLKISIKLVSVQSSEEKERFLIIVQDVDEQIKQEQELKQNSKLLSEAQKVGQLGYFIIDFNKGHWQVSDILEQILELQHISDKSIENWLSIIHPKHREETNHIFEQALASKQVFKTRYIAIQQISQRPIWVEVRGETEYDSDGAPVKMLGTIRNINDTMNYIQSIENQNRRFREIAWTSSHLLRAPLTRMQSMISYLNASQQEKGPDLNISKEIDNSLLEMDNVIKDVVGKAQVLEEEGYFKLDLHYQDVSKYKEYEIILVDDDPIINLLHERALSNTISLPVRNFTSGEEFLQFLEQDGNESKGYLILLDINMPGKSGWDVLDTLSEMPKSKQCLVVMLSSSTDRDDLKKSNQFPIVLDFLQKPLNEFRLARLFNLGPVQAILQASKG